MLSALLLGLVSLPTQIQTLELYRGAIVGGEGYWAVSDTFLDSTEADRAKGGLFTLEGGKGRTILIKFGDLERAIPATAKITKATLFLSPSSPDKPILAGVSSISVPWGEGPMFVVSMGRAQEEKPARLAATWKQRRSGQSDWQQPGATGPSDAKPIAGVQLQMTEKEIAIEGLADAVQSARNRWHDNHGFAITFAEKCEFFSSQAKNGKPRLVIEYSIATPLTGPDLSVQWLDRLGSGSETTYRATIKNVGDTAAEPFFAQWTVGENPGAQFQVNKSLQPGEESVVEFKKEYRKNGADHRAQPLMIRLVPASPESNANNDALLIYEDSIPVGFSGGKIDADAMQALARRINEVYFAQSRFSFAPEGVIERIRVVPSQEQAEVVIDLAGGPDGRETVRRLLQSLTGLAPTVQKQSLSVEGQAVAYNDPFPGISGFGDTRYDGLIAAGFPMVYAPVASPIFDNMPIEPTDLLSATETASINLALGKRGKDRLGILWDQPATVILRATDMTGKALDGAELAFYQLENGQMPSLPTQTILTKDGGTVILETRGGAGGIIDKDALHQLKKNPFGDLRSDGSNGTILVRALINGETEWGWLKAWQLTDAFHRGNRAAAIIDVRFNAPSGPVDRSTNLARGRLIADKAGSLPAKLTPLVDEDATTQVELGSQPGDWIEIDLGRDRPVGEVQVHYGQMPVKFDLQAYATGQAAPEADAWVKDLNSTWTRENRMKTDGFVPYRGPMIRARFIRIVNRSGGSGKIGEVRIFPLKAE